MIINATWLFRAQHMLLQMQEQALAVLVASPQDVDLKLVPME